MYNEDSEAWMSKANLYNFEFICLHVEKFRLLNQYNWINEKAGQKILYPNTSKTGYFPILMAGYRIASEWYKSNPG
jgi:hypothetical protein